MALAKASSDTSRLGAAWRSALTRAEGKFGKTALEGWVKAYAKQLAKQTDRVVLAGASDFENYTMGPGLGDAPPIE